MSDTDDHIAQMQMQLASQNMNPSFAGLQAPGSQAPIQNLLAQLKQQQYLQQTTGPGTGGPYGWLTAPARRDFASLGQQAGNAALGVNPAGGSPMPPGPIITGQQPGQAPAPASADGSAPQQQSPQQSPQGAPGQSPAVAYMNRALMAARQYEQALLAKGSDPNQARIASLQMLVQAGIPGASDALVKAKEDSDKNLQVQAGTSKDNAQAANFANESKNRDLTQQRETSAATYGPMTVQPGGFRGTQTNALGKTDSVELKPNLAALGITDPGSIENIAQMIAAGRLAPLSSSALRTAGGQQIMARVNQINPAYDQTQYQQKAATMADFSSKGKSGQSVKAFNVGLSHLDTLAQAGSDLGNTDSPIWNKATNALGIQVGQGQAPAFNATKAIVSSEIAKAIIGSNNALADRQELQQDINNAASPAALQAVIQKYRSLMAGQLAGLRTSYENGTGNTDFETKFLEPRSRDVAHKSPEYTSVFPQQPARSASPDGWSIAPAK